MKRKRKITKYYLSPAEFKTICNRELPKLMMYALNTLHEEFGFGTSRMIRFTEEFNSLNEWAGKGILGKRHKFSTEDIADELKNNYSIDLRSYSISNSRYSKNKQTLEDIVAQFLCYSLKVLQMSWGFGQDRLMRFMAGFDKISCYSRDISAEQENEQVSDLMHTLISKYKIDRQTFVVSEIEVESAKKNNRRTR